VVTDRLGLLLVVIVMAASVTENRAGTQAFDQPRHLSLPGSAPTGAILPSAGVPIDAPLALPFVEHPWGEQVADRRLGAGVSGGRGRKAV
jgi:hypothetical protein